ncbi:MAG: SIS domain-containing protein [Candidatus Riflebacteria bacterium]|nr:SIS domain-containing protein [Candidatus Riflebacteria bacterium]
MCGVIGLIYEKDKSDIGVTASRLLRMLEYRGYDSTGAVVQTDSGKVTLLKDVGAPSKLTVQLGIDKLAGRVFCGQVRWATFGAVTKENAQPHEMCCKTHIYGAHNGNITNCQQLKEWLVSEGHEVKSDNDGEMLVHTIEHFFAHELLYKNADDPKVREIALKSAVVTASKKVTGSFASVVVDPVTCNMVAIKAGSSLYIGRGNDPAGGDFTIASSDLASVLQLTKILIPIKESEFAFFSHGIPFKHIPEGETAPVEYSVNRDKSRQGVFELHDLATGKILKHAIQRSLLKVEETRLQHPYKYFMEQEIAHQIQTTRRVLTLFTGGNPVTKILRKHHAQLAPVLADIKKHILELAAITDAKALKDGAHAFFDKTCVHELQKFMESLNIGQSEVTLHKPVSVDESVAINRFDVTLESSYASFLEELKDSGITTRVSLPLLLKFMDAIFEIEDIRDIEARLSEFVKLVGKAWKSGGTIYMLACGTSFHAAKTAALFFNEIAGLSVVPLLPGEFRAQCTNSLRPEDAVIGISQSGETKDLIDVFSFIEKTRPTIRRICILNNTNSTLALEKSDLFIPLFCGPEIAVPATKSFMNQLLVMAILAIRLKEGAADDYLDMLRKIPDLIDKTLKTTQKETDEIAEDLYLKPSMHILATRILGIAKEGALKIREVVLNHTEGFEGSEFKHGPNTILGVNTVFGLDSIQTILDTFCNAVMSALERPEGRSLDGFGIQRLFSSVAEYAFKNIPPKLLNDREHELFTKIFEQHNFFDSVYANYPLLFITCPNETDIQLTISQINTHKIRGANVYLVAEDNDMLREAVSIAPANGQPYRHGYVTLPRTDSLILSIFTITTVLQTLALKMSLRKMDFLNRLEIETHGVHPDVPKNVSKSITVD